MRYPLTILPGIVADDSAFSTQNKWKYGNNVRFYRGSPQNIGGWSAFVSNGAVIACRNILPWVYLATGINYALGCYNKLWVANELGSITDITPAALAAGLQSSTGNYLDVTGRARTWSLDTWGIDLIASPSGGTIYYWTAGGGLSVAIGAAPAKINCAMVTPTRQVMAFGCNEEVSGTYNAMCIRWSDIEDYTDWTTTAANNAGEYILQGKGQIIGSRLLGSDILVWTDGEMFLGQFIGAADETFRFTRVGESCGLIGPNAATVVDNVAYWLSPDKQFRSYSIGGIPEIVPCPVRGEFADNFTNQQMAKICATPIQKFKEVWWFYPDARDGAPLENSRYVAFAINESKSAQVPVWHLGQLARSAAVDISITPYPIMAASTTSVYQQEFGTTKTGSGTWSIESGDFAIGEGEDSVMLTDFYPDFKDQAGTVSLTVKVRDYPQSTAVSKGPYSLTTATLKSDFRVSGRVFSFSLSGTTSTDYMRLGRSSFTFVKGGKR
jgi:hypothetical protein